MLVTGIDVVVSLAGLVLVLVLAHGVNEKMSSYDAVSNMLVLFCCAGIELLTKSCGERKEQCRTDEPSGL
jgi:uncharacterized membrane protein